MLTFHDRLDAYLAATPGSSLAEFSRRAKVDRSIVSKLRAGKLADPGPAVAKRLATALDCDVADLAFGEPRSPGASAAEADGLAAWNEIRPDPANPRRTFDGASIDALALSLIVDGVLQNLVVRPAAAADGTGPRYVLISGERRWRAIRRAIESRQWDAEERNIPVRVLDVGAGPETRALALIENLQREDLAPLDEGAAYVELQKIDPEKWDTASIAARIGRTARYVQQRMALDMKLAPEAKTALAKGEIDVTRARALALAPVADQAGILDEIKAGKWGHKTAEDTLGSITRGMIPVAYAKFDPALYTGEIVVATGDAPGDDGKPRRLFADTEQFKRLQAAAFKALMVELRARRPGPAFVKVVDYMSGTRPIYTDAGHYRKAAAGERAGVLATYNERTGEIRVVENVVKDTGDDGAGDLVARAQREAEDDWREHVKELSISTRVAVATALAARPEIVKRLLLIELLGRPTPIAAGLGGNKADWSAHAATLAPFDALRPESKPADRALRSGHLRSDAPIAAALAAAREIPDDQIDALIVHGLVGDAIGTPSLYNDQPSIIDDTARALADVLGVEIPPVPPKPKADPAPKAAKKAKVA